MNISSLDRSKKEIAVVGLGYVGLPLAVAAAEAGWRVNGVDISVDLVDRLNSGTSHIEDISDSQLQLVINSGRFQIHSSFDALEHSDICIICVPTPLNKEGKPELGPLLDAVKNISGKLREGALIINESTSYPGTLTELIQPNILKGKKSNIESLYFASAPERIDPGNQIWKLRTTPRVIAGLDQIASLRAREFYDSICDHVSEVSSPEVAEMSKLLENTFRQVNIALINQLVPLCHKLKIDIREVIDAAATKPYGYMSFYPGAGVGGHCIPIDPLYLLARARDLGIDLPFIESADQVNSKMPVYVVNRLTDIMGHEIPKSVLIMGVAYKAGVSDLRESPALNIAKILITKGIGVYWIDPLVEEFPLGAKWSGGMAISGAIVVTAQKGLPVIELASAQVPILDCTGAFKGVSGVSQL